LTGQQRKKDCEEWVSDKDRYTERDREGERGIVPLIASTPGNPRPEDQTARTDQLHEIIDV